MAKKITINQLKRAIKTAPKAVRVHGTVFIRDSINAVKQHALMKSPWRVGQSSGGAPRDTGRTRGAHYTKIHPGGLSGEVYVSDAEVPYAKYVHGDRDRPHKMKGKNLMTRPWLVVARKSADPQIDKNFGKFGDEILKHIAN